VKALIGTYRGLTYLPEALDSLSRFCSGITEYVFIDDGPRDSVAARWMAERGQVVATGGKGYAAAFAHLCRAAQRQPALVFEEDFTLTRPLDVDRLELMLFHRPWLAQIAVLRQPWFPPEIEAGGVIEALRLKGHTFHELSGLTEHAATFTCNPSVWRGDVFASGWPQCRGSEDAKRVALLRAGYRFAYLPGIGCEHHGVRSGRGY